MARPSSRDASWPPTPAGLHRQLASQEDNRPFWSRPLLPEHLASESVGETAEASDITSECQVYRCDASAENCGKDWEGDVVGSDRRVWFLCVNHQFLVHCAGSVSSADRLLLKFNLELRQREDAHRRWWTLWR